MLNTPKAPATNTQAAQPRLDAIMTIYRQPVNVLPAQLPPGRLAELTARYREWLHDPGPDSPPRWYVAAILDALQATRDPRPGAA